MKKAPEGLIIVIAFPMGFFLIAIGVVLWNQVGHFYVLRFVFNILVSVATLVAGLSLIGWGVREIVKIARKSGGGKNEFS